MKDFDGDPEEFVSENRERIVSIIRTSEDPFARACAWALLDRYTPNQDLEEIRDEFDVVSASEDES